jgi:hypothetical protein
MKDENKFALVLGVLSVAAPVGFGLGFGWALWVILTSVAVLLLITFATRYFFARRPESEPLPAPVYVAPQPVLPAPPQYYSQSVPTVTMPSGKPDYYFRFSATVCWKAGAGSLGQHANPAGIAVETILARAREFVATQPPTDVEFVRHQLNGLLGAVGPDTGQLVEAWATDVSLTLSQEDSSRLWQLSEIRKDEDVWEHKRNYERNKRAYLESDVLKDTGSAVVWWLAREEGKDKGIEEAVDLIGPLAQLTAAANNTEISHLHRHLVPSAPGGEQYAPDTFSIDDLHTNGSSWPAPEKTVTSLFADFATKIGFGTDDPELALFADRAANALSASGHPEEADEIRRRFNTPPPEPDDEPLEGSLFADHTSTPGEASSNGDHAGWQVSSDD